MLQSLLIYNFFKGTSNSKLQKYLRIIYSVKNLKIPNFQIFGKDIIRLGIKPGPKIGKLIKLIESWWILNNFKPSKKECLKKLEELI
jgi:poly(A) polymerase